MENIGFLSFQEGDQLGRRSDVDLDGIQDAGGEVGQGDRALRVLVIQRPAEKAMQCLLLGVTEGDERVGAISGDGCESAGDPRSARGHIKDRFDDRRTVDLPIAAIDGIPANELSQGDTAACLV
jgi:hypothetical protein